jgi:hypothetical protein
MPVRILWSLFTWFYLILPLQAQNWRSTPYEIYGGIVFSNYFGDIGGWQDDNNWNGLRDIDLTATRPGISGGFRYFPISQAAISGNLALGWLSGNDLGGKNDRRGYRFNTLFAEPTVRAEFMAVRDRPFLRKRVNRRGLVRNYATFSAYVFGGAGAVVYHVIPNELLARRQENDNIDYSPFTFVFPAGLGIKFGIRNYTDIGLEIGGRYMMNDYLDGLTTDISTSNDVYYLTSVNMAFRLPGQRLRFN